MLTDNSEERGKNSFRMQRFRKQKEKKSQNNLLPVYRQIYIVLHKYGKRSINTVALNQNCSIF